MFVEFTKNFMKTKTEKQIEKQKDIEFAREMKVRDGRCAICGTTSNLNTHHIMPREDRRLRHDPLNAINLCILHHKFSLEISPHKNALEFFLWLEKNRPEQLNYLRRFSKYGNN